MKSVSTELARIAYTERAKKKEGPCFGMGSVGATTGESKIYKQMVHRSLEQ